MGIPIQLQPYEIKRIRKICNHESGHYIIARELGFKTHGISIIISPGHGHLGGSIIEPCTPGIQDLDSVISYIEKRIQVLYAGVIAESMNTQGDLDNGYAIKEWETGGGMNDHAKIRELGHVIRNIKFPSTIDEVKFDEELKNIDDTLIQKTAELVVKRFELILGIGDKLSQKVKSYDIEYVLEETEINEVMKIKEIYLDDKSS